ncbi:hypothetical protein BD770DRAFT_448875 [Pilaira anomala]|nr:hypothetical protein BD770DRAFT_448875 [Pilaira anomala]
MPFVLQSTQAFCIYNRLDGADSTLHIFDTLLSSRSFEKTIRSGEKECCHYSNLDCNSYGKPESGKDFNVRFGFNGDRPEDGIEMRGSCDGGGAVIFRGSSMDNVSLLCLHSDGVKTSSILRPT